VATGDAVQDLDASKEAFLKQFLLKARAPEVLPEVSPTPSPASGLEAGTPSLVNELNSCSSSTASLSTLVESEVSADDDGQGKALPRQIEIL